jgi:hypothetical protein
LALFVTTTRKEKPMTKFRILGIVLGASALLLPALTGPAAAKDAAKRQAAQVCDPRDPGNPYSKKYDYWEWSAYRFRGSYDTRAEWTCQPIPPVAYQKGWLQDY